MMQWLRLYLLLILTAAIGYSSDASAQFAAYGEFNINAGRASDPQHENSTIIFAAGKFGVQYYIFAVSIGAGPVLTLPDNPARKRPIWDEISVDFPVGAMLRIPVDKNLLIAGVDLSSSGYAPHIGLLFPGKWHYRGVFLKAVIGDFQYFGLGLKTTLTHD